jgi:hypothetical protein
MVQPRKEQVKNLKTRHARFEFEPIPGDAYTDVADATLNSSIISNTPGGAEEDSPATVLGSVSELYVIIAADSISINLNGAGPVTVTFAGTDTTTSRVAANINTTLGATIAFNEEGYLRLTSTITGGSSSIVLADVVGGTLAKLGLTVGTTTGATAPVRGVVTKSPTVGVGGTLLGGFVPLKTGDGKNIVTDTSSLSLLYFSASQLTQRQDIPGGFPIHARIGRNPAGTQYRFSYYAQMATEPDVVTANSDFAALDGTDTIDIKWEYKRKRGNVVSTITPGPVTITFPAFPYTRDQLIDRINDVVTTFWIGNGAAYVEGVVCQPFGLENPIDTLSISVDGGGPQTINLDAADVTAQEVVNRINTTLVGATASVVSRAGDNNYVKIESDNTDGLTSSLEFAETTGTRKIGITPGLYRGFFVAEPYGVSEIRIRGFQRGSSAKITLSSVNPVTFTRMGLTAGVYVGDDSAEQKVNFPELSYFDPTDVLTAVALIPEVLEYGEVDLSVESITEEFGVKIVTNQWAKGADVYDISYTAGNIFEGYARGIKDVNKPILTNSIGLVDSAVLLGGQAPAEMTLKKFIRGDWRLDRREVDALVATNIETPGTGGNPLAKAKTFIIDIDPDGTLISPHRAEIRFFRDAGGPFTPVSIGDLAGIVGMPWAVVLASGGGNYTGIYADGADLRLADINTSASGTATGGREYLPLTDSTARYPRVFEQEASASPQPSLVGKANSIWTATCGDGTNSWGDFNGTDAIQQAIAYWVANVNTNGLMIRCKPGNFNVNAGNGIISIPTGKKCVIEGINDKGTYIVITDATDPAIDVQNNAALILKNVMVRCDGAPSSSIELIRGAANFIAHDVEFKFMYLHAKECDSYSLERCLFSTNGEACILITAEFGETIAGQYLARDCTFYSGDDNPVLRVQADSSIIPITTFEQIKFDNCQMFLRSTTNSAGNLSGNCGIIDLDPNGSSTFSATGIIIRDIIWKDCEVHANVASSGISTLIHMIPTTNGSAPALEVAGYVTVTNCTIDGGRWTAPAGVDSVYSPFVIAGASNIFIRNATFGYDGTGTHSYGGPTADLGFHFTGLVGVPPITSEWGALALYARERLEIKDITILGLVQESDCGDLFVRYEEVCIDGINMTYVKGGPGSPPTNRIRWRPASQTSSPRGLIKKIWMIGTLADAGTNWTGTAFHYYEPTIGIVEFEHCHVENFEVSGGATTGAGFFIPDVATGAFYPSSPKDVRDLSLTRCRFSDCQWGFYFFSGTVTQNISNVSIVECDVRDNTNDGIYFNIGGASAHLDGNLEIRGNYCTRNGQGSATQPGIYVSVTHCDNGSISIISNRSYNNTSNATNEQIALLVAGGAFLRGTVIGNDCEYQGTVGNIKVSDTTGALAPGALVRGCETEYVSPGAGNCVLGWTSTFRMIHNSAELETP